MYFFSIFCCSFLLIFFSHLFVFFLRYFLSFYVYPIRLSPPPSQFLIVFLPKLVKASPQVPKQLRSHIFLFVCFKKKSKSLFRFIRKILVLFLYEKKWNLLYIPTINICIHIHTLLKRNYFNQRTILHINDFKIFATYIYKYIDIYLYVYIYIYQMYKRLKILYFIGWREKVNLGRMSKEKKFSQLTCKLYISISVQFLFTCQFTLKKKPFYIKVFSWNITLQLPETRRTLHSYVRVDCNVINKTLQCSQSS